MKTVKDSQTETMRILRYADLNHHRRLFGGVLMQWIDEAAGIVAGRHAGGDVITAAVDSLVFQEPAFLGDLLVLNARITYIGNTSMEVRVDAFVEGKGGQRSSINRAYLVMVSIDEEGVPRKVPPIRLETEEEEREWEMAQKRNDLRKMRRKEEF